MNKQDLSKIFNLIETARVALDSAQKMMAQYNSASNADFKDAMPKDTTQYEEEESQIVEGYFDGQNMLGPEDQVYPVPANYASKSKLVEGDRLKLTILKDGRFLYKQISPIERKTVKGTLLKEDGQYKVITDEGSYRVLLASVTYYKGEHGDEVSLLIPAKKESTWGTIEALIPHMSGARYETADAF